MPLVEVAVNVGRTCVQVEVSAYRFERSFLFFCLRMGAGRSGNSRYDWNRGVLRRQGAYEITRGRWLVDAEGPRKICLTREFFLSLHPNGLYVKLCAEPQTGTGT